MLLGLLPPIGLEIPSSCYAVNIPLKLDVLGVITLDFKGGIRERVEANLGKDKLHAFPPQGNVYQLQEPVDFAPVGAPNKAVAQLLAFPSTWSHNP